MDSSRKAALTEAGINVDDALERFMGNEMLLERFWKKFGTDKSFADLLDSVSRGDRETALRAAHTLKGVSGSLGFTALQHASQRTVDLIRAGDWEGAVGSVPEVKRLYAGICSALGLV